MEDNVRKGMYIYVCNRVTAVQQKLAEHCKSSITKKKSHLWLYRRIGNQNTGAVTRDK